LDVFVTMETDRPPMSSSGGSRAAIAPPPEFYTVGKIYSVGKFSSKRVNFRAGNLHFGGIWEQN